VYAPVGPAGLDPTALELLAIARRLDPAPTAVALGPGSREAANALAEHGASRVVVQDDPVFVDSPGRPAAHVLASLIDRDRPALVLFPGTYEGRDVAGRVQGRFGLTLMGNASDVPAIDRARSEIYGATKIVDVELGGPEPRLVLVRPRSVSPQPVGGTANVEEISVEIPEAVRGVTVVERHEEAAGGPRLEEARVVIAGGRGLGGPEAFPLLDELAAAIGSATVGASRAAVDAGWIPYSAQIGQTGKTVKPEVYLAVGVSGALQHVVGMKGSHRIVAINKDPEAPILRIADLGVVGDLFELVPALTEEIRRRRSS
jgi:electron transfer flavoprotein alpha subunit